MAESVLFSYNDIDLRWVGNENWTYTLKCNVSKEDLQHNFVILTFNGLDTLTKIDINGRSIGSTNNMFVRYRFDVKDFLVDVSLLKILNLIKLVIFLALIGY